MGQIAGFSIENGIKLTPDQERAVSLRGRDLIVTAGAGSGKTRTLVARYLSLLTDGCSPRQLAAITFTEKAAREMRNRVRQALTDLRGHSPAAEAQEFWGRLEGQMDSARIGTIHSLCSEILRAHPAEAGVDPEFQVLDEGAASALRAQIIVDTLAWAVIQPGFLPLFEAFQIATMEKLVSFALSRRLDLAGWVKSQGDFSVGDDPVFQACRRFTEEPQVISVMDELKSMQRDGSLDAEAGEPMAQQVESLLQSWAEIESALKSGSVLHSAQALHSLRKFMVLNVGKRTSLAKSALKDLRTIYDRLVEPWLKEAPDEAIELLSQEILPLALRLFEQAIQAYQNRLAEQGALDFDDLEAGALHLLQRDSIRQRWQNEIQALLVDEFQDTNQRQREIIEAVSGQLPGRLFVVGDGRQSIYRFRGADVTVFHDVQDRIQTRGGESITLNRTYRAHTHLVDAMGDLLKPAMAAIVEPIPPYWIPYSPLEAQRQAARPGNQPPYIEFILGLGEDAVSGRQAAGSALAGRLLALKAAGQIQYWDDVALLFRASTGFPAYEDAFEQAGIPFVTVAGGGFYDRPEIRDMLNILRALADPWDDLAVAGLLRSPAFGLPDAALYRLRWPETGAVAPQPQPFLKALAGDLAGLSEDEQALARRASAFLNEFMPLVDRLPVADLLKRVVDRSNYRSILATGKSRLWRNLDKLLQDARKSRLIQVRAFLDYLNTLRDVGAREGEAAVEAEGSVQLMTIHKSKGLEFQVVVIADAAHSSQNRSETAYLLPEASLGLKLDRYDAVPMVYCLLKVLDQNQQTAEEKRLLYVAATRAKEKLLISGHLSKGKANGWLKTLAEAAGLDLESLANNPGTWQTATLPCGQPVGAWASSQEDSKDILDGSTGRAAETGENRLPEKQGPQTSSRSPQFLPDTHLGTGAALYLPLVSPEREEPALEEEPGALDKLPERPWRATGSHTAPAVVVGDMVHYAIQRLVFPGDPRLDLLLETIALNAGLVDTRQRDQAAREAHILLRRLHDHPMWAEITNSIERHHEVPYARLRGRKSDTGYIDLLYRTANSWILVDFKTDELRSEAALDDAVINYRHQMERYAQAVRSLLGVTPTVQLCFLNYQGILRLYTDNYPEA